MRAALRIVPIIILFAAGCKPVDQAPPAEEVEAGNGRVVAGQQGPVQVPGESLATMTFADRMARHQAPGPGDGPKPVSVVTLDSLAMAKIVGEYALTYQKETTPLNVSQSGERLVMTSQAMGLVRDTVLAIAPTLQSTCFARREQATWSRSGGCSSHCRRRPRMNTVERPSCCRSKRSTLLSRANLRCAAPR